MEVQLGQINTEIYIMVVVFFAAMFAFLRYVSVANQKREDALMKFVNDQAEKTQLVVDKQLEYNKNKNDHMERIADKFSESTEHMIEKVTIMSTELRGIAERQNHNINLLRSELDKSTRVLQDYNHMAAKWGKNK